MTIKELQREIEDSLEAVQAMPHLPAELQGLRLLVPHKVDCRVTIRNVQNGGRLRLGRFGAGLPPPGLRSDSALRVVCGRR